MVFDMPSAVDPRPGDGTPKYRPADTGSMPDYEDVEYEYEDGVATITLDRPDALNAMSPNLLAEMEDALLRAEDEEGARAVVLTGNGRAFTSGYDIGDEEGERPSIDRRLRDHRTHLDTIWELTLPVVAAVDGFALAGGCNLAIACDLTYATESSTFGYPDFRFGEPPAKWVLPFVANSLKHARELLYTGKMIPAEEAERMGLVNRTVPDGELDEAVAEEVDGIKKVPGLTVDFAKQWINEAQESRGDRSGRIDEYLGGLLQETEAPKTFREIREEEGLEAALDWTHEVDKEW